MEQISQLLLQILTEIGGGPETPENNLVRFALPTVFWAVLFCVAWSRQRGGQHARERLLVWGFGLAFFREIFMLAHMSEKLFYAQAHASHSIFIEPLEHFLSIAAIILIAAAFLRYILDEKTLPRRYLTLGLSALLLSYPIVAFWWTGYSSLDKHLRFNMTAPAVALHLFELTFIAAAVIILIKNRHRVGNIVIVALSLLFVSEMILLINFVTDRMYAYFLCPIGNNLHIWAIPVFGAVYFHEQSVEKRRAEAALLAYRDHLQDLVEARTAELKRANEQLERAAVLEERQRIAAEMHDGLAQTLSAMGLRTGQTASLLDAGKTDQASRECDKLQEIIGLAVRDVRRAIASLQESPKLRIPLQDALQQLAVENNQSKGAPSCEFSAVSEPVLLDSSDQEQVLRVVQEALLNARRHADSERITVRLQHAIDEYTVLIEDNGIGFDPAEVARTHNDHFGLSIMRARASRINGTFSVRSSPGSGTAVCLSWPARSSSSRENEHGSIAEKAAVL